jgi:hypothetical protein
MLFSFLSRYIEADCVEGGDIGLDRLRLSSCENGALGAAEKNQLLRICRRRRQERERERESLVESGSF